eukprot:maker-scaffold_29-snap-gene-2.3-mRNA-1 protein AED:0.14 eAED:0.14 QI:134/1/1/1/1/1/2/160/401
MKILAIKLDFVIALVFAAPLSIHGQDEEPEEEEENGDFLDEMIDFFGDLQEDNEVVFFVVVGAISASFLFLCCVCCLYISELCCYRKSKKDREMERRRQLELISSYDTQQHMRHQQQMPVQQAAPNNIVFRFVMPAGQRTLDRLRGRTPNRNHYEEQSVERGYIPETGQDNRFNLARPNNEHFSHDSSRQGGEVESSNRQTKSGKDVSDAYIPDVGKKTSYSNSFSALFSRNPNRGFSFFGSARGVNQNQNSIQTPDPQAAGEYRGLMPMNLSSGMGRTPGDGFDDEDDEQFTPEPSNKYGNRYRNVSSFDEADSFEAADSTPSGRRMAPAAPGETTLYRNIKERFPQLSVKPVGRRGLPSFLRGDSYRFSFKGGRRKPKPTVSEAAEARKKLGLNESPTF